MLSVAVGEGISGVRACARARECKCMSGYCRILYSPFFRKARKKNNLCYMYTCFDIAMVFINILAAARSARGRHSQIDWNAEAFHVTKHIFVRHRPFGEHTIPIALFAVLERSLLLAYSFLIVFIHLLTIITDNPCG